MKTRVVACAETPGSAPSARPGVAVIGVESNPAPRATQLLRAGANEVLLLAPDTALPEQICMFWLDEAARHATMAVTASLLRHLPAEAVCVATAPSGRRDARRANALRALLDARSEARAAHALETRTELVPGEGAQAVGDYLAGLSAPLLVLGTADISAVEPTLATLLARRPGMPVLVVFREGARAPGRETAR